MSVAFDKAIVSSFTGTSGNTNTWTHTPTGTPSIVTVNITYREDTGNTGTGLTVSTMTYGGVTMTKAGSQVVSTGAQSQEKWYLISPPTGAQTVAVTWINDGQPLDDVVATATSTTYTSTNTPTVGTIQSATGTTSPITKTVAGVLSTSILDNCGSVSDGSSAFITITVNGTGETLRSGTTNIGDASPHGRAQQYTSSQTGTGSVTANATESANRTWGIMVLELKEGVVAGAARERTLLGVGT